MPRHYLTMHSTAPDSGCQRGFMKRTASARCERNFEFVVTRGHALLDKASISRAALGGGVRALEEAGAEVVPALSAVPPPGGPDKEVDMVMDHTNKVGHPRC
ncbi:M81 family metallopeptidase [Mesorhizobium sp. NZP2077]|uniref:M81 family metallopeptidase n=1 Tax=Mesorhizobium sp. NZP2077 TaxID=2483404 RepID=UPI001FF0386B|nr:M81 family metallopeptidase [Mesorhizobium sp. NZP2077]